MSPKNLLPAKFKAGESKYLFYYFFVLVYFFLYFSSFFIKGQDTFIDSHDNLDSINMLGIFDGEFKGSFFPVDKNPQYTMPGVDQRFSVREISFEKLLFYLFGFFKGYVLNDIIIRVFAFFGMFYLIKIFQREDKFPMIFQILLALSFASIPFRTLASLTIAGLPMLAVSFLNLYFLKNKIISYAFILFFGFYSSFVHMGFFIGIVIIFVFIYLLLFQKLNKWIFGGAALLFLSYLVSHHNLFINVFLLDFETNRSITSATFFAKTNSSLKQFLSILYNNQYHAITNHGLIILPSIFVLIFENFHKSKQKTLIVIFVSFIFFSAIIVGLSYYYPFIKIIGSAGGFTWNRFYWINPLVWYILWAIVLIEMYNDNEVNLKFLFSMLLISLFFGLKTFPNTLIIFFIVLLLLFFLLSQNIKIFKNNHSSFILILLIMQIFLNTYSYTYNAYNRKPSFKDFFSEEQFDDIISSLGLEKNHIRIGCIGFYPSVANYNGIKTLGAYENIYPLDFKNQFYEIIKGEISKDDYLYNYFTKWGNRIYLFENEIGMPYYDQQYRIKLYHQEITCDLNIPLMKRSGTSHIFSTSKIKNADEINIKLIYTSEEPNYFYRLFVYKL